MFAPLPQSPARLRPVCLVPILLLIAAAPPAEKPRLPADNLMVYRGDDNQPKPVKTVDNWASRRAEIVREMESVMGELPGDEKRCPLEMQVEEEVDCGSYVRRRISYASEPGSRVPAYLLVPKSAMGEGAKPAPGVLCLHPTNFKVGYDTIVGLSDGPDRSYGNDLAERGYVVLAPSYPLMANYQPDLDQLGWESGSLKAVWDNIRGLDLLETLPYVKPGKFGAVGHSLGGHNAIFTSVFELRIEAVVTSCGFGSIIDRYGEPGVDLVVGKGWAQKLYIARAVEYNGRIQDFPFDFAELIGALAPRWVLAISPLHDGNFPIDRVRPTLKAARPAFELYGHPERLLVEHPDIGHDFPPEMREIAFRLLDRVLR